MVYQDPNAVTWRESWWLGPLRVFFSKERSAELLRAPFKIGLKQLLHGIGIGKTIEFLMPELKTYWPAAYKFLLPFKNERWGFVYPVVCLKLCGYSFAFLRYIQLKWSRHVRPRDAIGADAKTKKTFFWSSDNVLPPTPEGKPQSGGVVFDKNKQRWYAQPILSIQGGLDRAFNYTGMSWWSFMSTEFSVGLEYPMTSMYRMLMHYCNVPKYNERATRHKLYQGVINTSFACFIVGDPESPDYGNVVMTNVVLPFHTDGMRFFSRLVFELEHGDHDSSDATLGYFKKAVCTYRDCDGQYKTEVWGSANHADNTFTEYDQDKQLDQAALIMIITVSLYSHAIVHWWANGAALVDKEVWPVQLGSSDITNWMNTQAIYLSWLFMGDQLGNIESILVRNNAQGLPIHFPTKENGITVGRDGKQNVWLTTGSRSKFHKMGQAGRAFLTKYIADHLPKIDAEMTAENKANPGTFTIGTNVDCVLAATIWHNAEHYYANYYFPLFGPANCVILQTDCSGLIRSLIAPIKYWLAKLRVKQYNDPVSQGLYNACLPIDKDFANNALCIGCAF